MKILPLLILWSCCLSVVQAQQHTTDAQVLAAVNNQVKGWVDNIIVIESIQTQNAQHMEWTDVQIKRANNQWQAELTQPKKPMIEGILNNDLSRYLINVQEQSQGLYLKLMVLDAKACSVGQSDISQNYWHGNEEVWRRTFLAGAGILFIGEMEQNKETEKFYIPVGITILDPMNNQLIGVALITFDAEKLLD